jgi:glutathione S-transferase
MRVHMLRGCPFAHRATFALREKNVPFEPVFFEMGKRPPELAAVSPHAKSPTVFDGDAVVWDSQIVLEYLEDRYPTPRLLPPDPAMRARVRMMAACVDKELGPMAGALVMEVHFKPKDKRDDAKIAEAKKAFVDALAPWDDRLRDREWLVGDSLSIADITLYTLIPATKRIANDVDVPPELRHLRAWLERMHGRPSSALVG